MVIPLLWDTLKRVNGERSTGLGANASPGACRACPPRRPGRSAVRVDHLQKPEAMAVGDRVALEVHGQRQVGNTRPTAHLGGGGGDSDPPQAKHLFVNHHPTLKTQRAMALAPTPRDGRSMDQPGRRLSWAKSKSTPLAPWRWDWKIHASCSHAVKRSLRRGRHLSNTAMARGVLQRTLILYSCTVV